MAGNHRATRKQAPARLSGRTIAVAVVVALVPAVWLGGQRLFGGSATPAKPMHTASAIPPAVTPSATTKPTPSAGPTTAKPSTTAKPPARLTSVAASVPRRLRVAGVLSVGFDNAISARAGGFTAGSTAEAARWDSRGKPASPGTDTVFLIGKVYRSGASAFDGLPKLKAGSKITIRTDKGLLTYTVTSSASRSAAGLLKRPEFTAKVPGRLVLVGILFDTSDRNRTGQYLVVVAQLSGARKA